MKKIAILISFVFVFGQTLIGQSDFRDIKTTSESETTIKLYLDSNSLDPIEGIYKTTSSNNYYRIAIKKYDDTKYLAIILDAENKNNWKVGNVKAYIEKSATDEIFSIRWLMKDKTPQETTVILKYGTLLSIFLTAPNGTSDELVFLKMYPSNKTETNKSSNAITVTGSGFFITTKGLLATNAHVVNGAKIIEIKVPNDFGSTTYNAKLILIDTKNDVAIIQIDDASFKELKPLPYGISTTADIGEKSFTIGYPLNDIMGTNYKVADGIISAKTGIADDVRYYQITIPIQPGNSGGPLFNSQGNIIGITSAKLNSKAVGVQVENVNYAIKAAYLSNLINMVPNIDIPAPTNQLATKELKEQIKILKDYVCLIVATD
jgi:S1-C subfamily serine protease